MMTNRADEYSEAETKQRMENAIRRAQKMPPKTLKQVKGKGRRSLSHKAKKP